MPEMDGYEATVHIRKNASWQGLPIIGVTAHAMADDLAHCHEVGMNEYLTKPYSYQALTVIMAKAIKQFRKTI